MTSAVRVVLRAREESRLLSGHRWVFSNEISRIDGEAPHGGLVEVVRRDGRPVGTGFYNAHSLIAVRLVGSPGEDLSGDFLGPRLRRALDLRRTIYPGAESFRVVHGESDDLPGLIVDKFEDCLAVQTVCLGMDRLKDRICDLLEEIFRPRCIVERNESALREREGLEMVRGVLRGTIPERVRIVEEGVVYEMDPLGGQKTGFYLDQRENRMLVRRWAGGRRVLDVYCHDGGFALHAARGGAAEVIAVDSDAQAAERARRNVQVNGLEGICRVETAEALEAMESLHRQGERFDLVVLDPPSFTRSRKNVPSARRGYEECNRKAMRILRRGGFLATSSCSFHITDETFLRCLVTAAGRTERTLRQLAWRSQAPDHPVLPAMPETRYLKFGLFVVD